VLDGDMLFRLWRMDQSSTVKEDRTMPTCNLKSM
jgi:hypothetical protein